MSGSAPPFSTLRARAKQSAGAASTAAQPKKQTLREEEDDQEEGEEVEETWLQEKVEDTKEALQAVIAAVPGPRVGSTGAPWLVVVPAAYLGLTLVITIVKTIRKLNSPRVKRQRQVSKNAGLVESIDLFLLPKEGEPAPPFTSKEFRDQERKFGFGAAEVVRKYLRYALNEKPFTPDLVASLIRLRRASGLTDEEVADVLNDISRRTVKAKGPVVMSTSGFTEKGLQRKAAVQALFSKLLYLAELEDFVSQSVRHELDIKAIFGVTDEDADSIRIVSLSSSEDLDKLDKALGAVAGEDASDNDD